MLDPWIFMSFCVFLNILETQIDIIKTRFSHLSGLMMSEDVRDFVCNLMYGFFVT